MLSEFVIWIWTSYLDLDLDFLFFIFYWICICYLNLNVLFQLELVIWIYICYLNFALVMTTLRPLISSWWRWSPRAIIPSNCSWTQLVENISEGLKLGPPQRLGLKSEMSWVKCWSEAMDFFQNWLQNKYFYHNHQRKYLSWSQFWRKPKTCKKLN